VNHCGAAYRVNPWGIVSVPAEAVPMLLATGGFHVAAETDVSAKHSTFDDLLDVAWSLPNGKVRATLVSILTNTNQRNSLISMAGPKTALLDI
jgi:hypothetical protein